MGYFLSRLTLFGPLYPFAFAKTLYPAVYLGHSSEPVFEVV